MTGLRPKSGILEIKAHMLSNVGADLPPPRILLNSNESAFGPSPHAIEAAAAAAAGLERYLENPVSLLGPAIARRHGLDPCQMALAWQLERPFMGAPIFGATDHGQLETAIGAAEITLSDEVRAEIAAAYRAHPMPI